MNLLEEILTKIETLDNNSKVEVYNKIRTDLIKSNQLLINLSRYKGIAKGLWNEEPQVFVDKLRDEDRI